MSGLGRGWARAPAIALVVLFAMGCGGRAPWRYYVLAPIAGAAPAGTAASPPVVIGVGPVRVPGYLDRPQIVIRQSADEIGLTELDRWGEPLAEGVPRTIAENLGLFLPNDRVTLLPSAGMRALQYQVLVDVARFDGTLGGSAQLEAQWRILSAEGKTVREARFTASEPAAEPTYSSLVAAMSRCLGGLSREIAAALKGL